MSSFGPISSGPIHPSCSLSRPSSSPSKSSSLGSSSLRPLTGSSMTSPVSGYLRPVGSIPPSGVPRDKHCVSSALDGSVPPSSPSALGGSIPPSSSLHSGGLYERHIGSLCSNASDGSIPPSSSSPSWRSLFVKDRPISRSSSLQARGSVSMGLHTLAVSSVSPSSPCVLMPHPLPVSRPSFTSFLRMGVGLVY